MTDPNLLGKGTNTYTNIFTFLGCPLTRELDDQVDAVVMGVPYDLATSGHRAHVMDPPVFAGICNVTVGGKTQALYVCIG